MIAESREAEFELLLRARRGAAETMGPREQVEVDAALARIDGGTYGWCQGCGRSIPLDRLREHPEARLCARCSSD